MLLRRGEGGALMLVRGASSCRSCCYCCYGSRRASQAVSRIPAAHVTRECGDEEEGVGRQRRRGGGRRADGRILAVLSL